VNWLLQLNDAAVCVYPLSPAKPPEPAGNPNFTMYYLPWGIQFCKHFLIRQRLFVHLKMPLERPERAIVPKAFSLLPSN